MSELIRSLLSSVDASTVTDVFSIIMILLFIIAIFSKCTNRFLNFLDYAPSLLTSLGILGTFTGIVIGLFEFNITDIDSSISLLLDGLKTAFITSILGITLSLILKLFSQCYNPTRFAEVDITMEHLYNTLCDQVSATQNLSSTVKNNQDSFLATQRELTEVSRKHQLDFIENQRILAEENRTIELKNQEAFLRNQESYLEKLDNSVAQFAREGVQSLVREMNEVVMNFNQHVQVEFGENFNKFGQRLDNFQDVVTALGEEFTQHEERIQYWTEHCDANVVSLARVRNEIEEIGSILSSVPDFITLFGNMVTEGQSQLSGLNSTLQDYGDISERINKALPQIHEKLTQYAGSTSALEKLLTQDIKQALNHYQETLVTAQQTALTPIADWQAQMDLNLKKLNDSYQTSIFTMADQTQTLENQVNLITKTLESMSSLDGNLINELVGQSIAVHRSSMQDLAVSQASTYQEMTDSLAALIQKNHTQSDRLFTRQVDGIEHHMRREIEEVMKGMGEALAIISGQFTRDYQGLIHQMQGLLNNHKAIEK